MLVSDIISEIRAIFGDAAAVQITDADIIRWVNDAQLQIARRVDSIKNSQNISSIKDQRYYSLPADFLKFDRVTYEGQALSHTTSLVLDKIISQADADYPSGTPVVFYFVAPDSIAFYPAPDTAGNTFSLSYSARPIEVTGTGDSLTLPVEMQRDVYQFVLSKCYELDDNFEQAEVKLAHFDRQVTESMANFKDPYTDTYPSVRDIY